MDLVTITDHDSVGAVEVLRRHPDFFASVEVTVRMPSGTEAHVAVYGIEERQHVEVERRRDDLPALVAYFNEQRLPFGVNHMFSRLTGRRDPEDWTWFERMVPLAETLNGSMPETLNRHARRLASQWGKASTGGSDSHSIRSVGTAWTEVPGARDVEEFLDGLRAGRGRVAGRSGGYWKLNRDVLEIIAGLFGEKAWTLWLAPLVAALPLITLINWLLEAAFAEKWSRQLFRDDSSATPASPDIRASEEAPA
jgi:predicted metal-dependent phosphoesterase TrpH